MLIITNRMILDGMEAAIKAGKLQAVADPDATGGGCLYQDRDGCRCAIGASLPDKTIDELVSRGQNNAAFALVEWDDLSIEFASHWFAIRMQEIHDSRGWVPYWSPGIGSHAEAISLFGEEAISLLDPKKAMAPADWPPFIAAVREHLDKTETAR